MLPVNLILVHIGQCAPAVHEDRPIVIDLLKDGSLYSTTNDL
jgi:hypothetical protein